MPFTSWVRRTHSSPSSLRKKFRSRLRIELLEDRVTPALLTVNSLADDLTPGDGLVTLREAINAHNNLGTTDLGETATGADTITFGNLTGQITLSLGSFNIGFSSGGSTTTLDLAGPGADVLSISGANSSRIFFNDTTSTLRIVDLTLQDGVSTDPLGGAAVVNRGTLILLRTAVLNNSHVGTADAFGAGVSNFGNATILSSYFAGNNGSPGPGFLRGAALGSIGTLNVVNSTFTGNAADDLGGAIFIESGSSATLTHNTLIGNRADSDEIGNGPGGALAIATGATVLLRNNILAGNTSTGGTLDDVFGIVDASSANNLIGVDTNLGGISAMINGNLIGSASLPLDPLVAPPNLYGGRTPLFALLPGSLALDAGGAFGVVEDQRGAPRINRADIGAFESSGFTISISGAPQSTLIDEPFLPITVTVQPNNPNEPVAGGFIQLLPPMNPNGPGASFSPSPPLNTGGSTTLFAAANLIPGNYQVGVVVDQSSPPGVVQLTNVGIATQIALVQGSTNPSFFGDDLFVDVTATGTDGRPINSGTIDLILDGSLVGTVDLATPTTVMIPSSLLPLGNRVLTAIYTNSGSTNIASSESQLIVTVVPVPSNVSIVANPSDLVVGTSVQITGMVTTANGATVPTGAVVLVVNGFDVAAIGLDTDGAFEFNTDDFPPGVNVVSVRYEGDAFTAPALSVPIVVMVNGAPQSTPIGNQVAIEGIESLFELGAFIDETGSAGPFTVTVDWGDGSEPTIFSLPSVGLLGMQPHTFIESGIFKVTVTISDGVLTSLGQSFDVTVLNDVPRLAEPLPPRFTLAGIRDFNFDDFTILDSGFNDAIQIVIDWGDGSDPTVINLGPGERQIPAEMLQHQFPDGSRTYRVTVTILDSDGAMSQEISAVTVQDAPDDAPDPLLDLSNFGDFADFIDDFTDNVNNDTGEEFDLIDLLDLGAVDQFTSAVDEFLQERFDEAPPAIEFRGAELIRQTLPRFGPPIPTPRPDMGNNVIAVPQAQVPLGSRVGSRPPVTSPLNEKSPLGTPINLFNSVFDSDDSVNLIDTLRRELSRPRPPVSPGNSGPMSRLPDGEGSNPEVVPAQNNGWGGFMIGVFGVNWWQGLRRGRRSQRPVQPD